MTRRAQKAKRHHTRRKHTQKRSSKRRISKIFGGAVYDPMKYDTFTVRYFQNLDLPALVQANLMDRLNLQLAPLSKAVQYALQISTKQMEACMARQGTSIGDEWKACEDKCNTLITNAVNQEIGSTAFMLKLLADSVIRPDGKKHRLKIGLDESFYKRSDTPDGAGCRLLTGRWKDDAPFLRLVLPTFKDPEKPTSGRLVMGFGPSASGKTYWAKTILGLLAQADNNFPDVFFAVDGGLVRESSAVYQLATEMAHCKGWAGFKNLHAGMFITGDIKKTMEQYLLQESRRVPVSLYVPETLGKCEFMVKGATMPLIRPCEEYLKTFLDITRDDKWIGLLIWQHATASNHMKDTEFMATYSNMKYRCVGCEASGKEREKDEGKPYEGDVYAQSMKNGQKYMELAPGGRYEIHNTGRSDGTSVMWDRSVKNPVTETFSTIMQGVPGITYVDHRSDLYGTPVPTENGYTKEGPAVMTKWEERKAVQNTANANANALRNKTKRAKRNAAAAAASIWKNMPSVSEIEENPALRSVALNIEANSKSGSAARRIARSDTVSDTASVLKNAAQVSRNTTRNTNPQAIMIRQSSDSLDARKKAEKEAANAHFERQSRGESKPTKPLSEAEKSVYMRERARTAAINAEHNEKSEANLNRKRREALQLRH